MSTHGFPHPYQRFGGLLLSILSTVACVFALALPALAETREYIVSPAELEREVAVRLMRVPEFRFIREEAKKLGVKVYLFGGTAAGFAHYTKWDLQREKGDDRFQGDRFDYDFTNIYRATQDLDVVVDGPPEVAEKLRQRLKETYPHFQGVKEQWEIRLLREDYLGKQALLNNPDFLNQHTDSNSTGMIDVTVANPNETIRDLRDWNSAEPQFLRDVVEGKIHFYFSNLHEKTSRFVDGKNPAIFSVIRFLTKAFQYELEMRPEDLAAAQKIIDHFDPASVKGYVGTWIEDNGKKLIRHAVNIEYAVSVMDRMGIREKLVAIQKNSSAKNTLAWWLSRVPLPTLQVGLGNGRTARELGIDVVAHETSELAALESMTRAHTGEPNVLISRQGVDGELAAYGNGFYTKRGRQGAKGTGLTIRFTVDSNAREGHDFFLANNGEFIIFLNKKALRVIPETLNISIVDFFKLVGTVEASDRGMIEKLRRKFANQMNRISPRDVAQIKKIVLAVEDSKSAIVGEWIMSPLSRSHPELIRQLIDKGVGAGTIAEWQLKGVETAPDLDAAVENLIRTLKSGDALAASVVLNGSLTNANLTEKLLSGKHGAEFLDLVYSPETMEGLVSVSYSGWIRSPLIWLRKVPDGRTYLEACLQANMIDSRSFDVVFATFKNGRATIADDSFNLFAEKFMGPQTLEKMTVDDVRWTLDRVMRHELKGIFASFRTTSKLVEAIVATKNKTTIPMIFTTAGEVLRSQPTVAEQRPDVVRPRFVRDIAETAITHKFTTETQEIHERARIAFIREFAATEVYDVIEEALKKSQPDKLVEFVLNSKDPTAKPLQLKLMEHINIYGKYDNPVSPDLHRAFLDFYREVVSKLGERERHDFVRSGVYHPGFTPLLITIIGEEGPERWIDFLRYNSNGIGGEVNKWKKDVFYRETWKAIVAHTKWQHQGWIIDYVTAEVATIARDMKGGTALFHSRLLPSMLDAISTIATPEFWRIHADLLRGMIGLSIEMDSFVVSLLEKDPSIIRSHPAILDALAVDVASRDLIEWSDDYARLEGREGAQKKREAFLGSVVYLLRHAETAASPKLMVSVFAEQWREASYPEKCKVLDLPHWKSHPALLRFQTREAFGERGYVWSVGLGEAMKNGGFARLEKVMVPSLVSRTVAPVRRIFRRAPTCPVLFGAS